MSDEHLQDPALARALRELDLPGPVVPVWSPAEVRDRGNRRRTRRRATWAGSGVVAAALAGALVIGPLTPSPGDDSAARSDAASSAPVRTAPPTPSPTVQSPSASTPPSPKADAVTLDITRQTLTTHRGGADQQIQGVVNSQAAKVLASVTTLRVAAKQEQQPVPSAIAGLGAYNMLVVWAVLLELPDKSMVYVGAFPTCAECPEAHSDHPMVGLPDDGSAKVFFDAVEVDDTVNVVGPPAAGRATTAPGQPMAPTRPTSVATTRTPATSVTKTAAPDETSTQTTSPQPPSKTPLPTASGTSTASVPPTSGSPTATTTGS
ncbi:hypothetical protein [Yinghuangia sp. YIM S10712]|uniref:hypothetical protein n=1 Tax=Yinghuangia sp. YIM S10712 TaxID=3436930 RepID=UPI003F52BA3F